MFQRLFVVIFAFFVLAACAGPPPSAPATKTSVEGDYRIELTYYHVTMGAQHSFLSVTKRDGEAYRLLMRLHATPVKMKAGDSGQYYDYWTGDWTEIGDCFKVLPMFDDGGGLFTPPAGDHLVLADENRFLAGRAITSIPVLAGDRETIRAALASILAFSTEINGASSAYDLRGNSEANCNSYTANVIDRLAGSAINSDQAGAIEWFPGMGYKWARLGLKPAAGDVETHLIVLNDMIVNPDPSEACVNHI